MFASIRLPDLRHLSSRPYRRRIFWSVIVPLLICSDLFFAVDRYSPSTWPALQRCFARRRAERFVESPDRIVFAASTALRPGLDPSHGYERKVSPLAPGAFFVHSMRAAECNAEYEEAEQLWCNARNLSWKSDGLGSLGMGARGEALMAEVTIFVHKLRLPSGAERLVFVDLSWHQNNVAQLKARLFATGDWSTASSGISSATFCVCSREPSSDFRVYAPQPDPGDLSRFTMAYETSGGYGVIEGQLFETDAISWEIVNGPAIEETMR